jgi:hypothetical protein
VPRYLAALQSDRTLAGESFASFELRRATSEEAPAAAIFTIAAPELAATMRDDADGGTP